MAVKSFGTTSIDPQITDDVELTTSALVLEGGQVLQVLFDDAAFTQEEGRERLLLALQRTSEAIQETDWPAA